MIGSKNNVPNEKQKKNNKKNIGTTEGTKTKKLQFDQKNESFGSTSFLIQTSKEKIVLICLI